MSEVMGQTLVLHLEVTLPRGRHACRAAPSSTVAWVLTHASPHEHSGETRQRHPKDVSLTSRHSDLDWRRHV